MHGLMVWARQGSVCFITDYIQALSRTQRNVCSAVSGGCIPRRRCIWGVVVGGGGGGGQKRAALVILEADMYESSNSLFKQSNWLRNVV